MPEVADRAHLFVDGSFSRIVGVGPAASHGPFDQSLAKGPHMMVVLVDNLGRFAEGNDLGDRKGLYGHLWEIKRLATVKPKRPSDSVRPAAQLPIVCGWVTIPISALSAITAM